MDRTPGHAWSELVPGAYVEDSSGRPWKLIEEHPLHKGKFLAKNVEGDTAIISDPGKPVTAWLPTPEEAEDHLRRILGARLMEENGYVLDAVNTFDVKPNRDALRRHLIDHHGEYVEGTLKMAELIACHDHAHAISRFHIHHTHKRLS